MLVWPRFVAAFLAIFAFWCYPAAAQQFPTEAVKKLRDEKKYAEAAAAAQRTLAEREQASGFASADLIPVLEFLAGLAEDQNRYDESVSYYKRILEIENWDRQEQRAGAAASQWLVKIAAIRRKQGEYAEARALYEQALGPDSDLDPRGKIAARNALAEVCFQTGDTARAEELYRQVLAEEQSLSGAAHSQTAMAHYNLGTVLAAEGKSAAASDAFDRALKILNSQRGTGTDAPSVALSLGGLYLQEGAPQKAESMFSGWTQAAPDVQVKAKNNLGVLHASRGNYRLAMADLQDAVKLPGGQDDWVANYNLAAVYAAAGEPQKARSTFGTLYAKKFKSADLFRSDAICQAANSGLLWMGPDPCKPVLRYSLNATGMVNTRVLTSLPNLIVERYPVIVAPRAVQPGQRFQVNVGLRIDKPEQQNTVRTWNDTKLLPDGKLQIVFPVTAGQKSWKVDVVLRAPDFEVEGGRQQSIDLPREGSSTEAVFHLRAGPEAKLPAAAVIEALFLKDGAPFASVEHTISTGVAVSGASSPAATKAESFVLPASRFESRAEVADVTLYHTETDDHCGIVVMALPRYFEVTCRPMKEEVLQKQYDRIREIILRSRNFKTAGAAAPGSAPDPRQVVAQLTGLGKSLFEMFIADGYQDLVSLFEELQRAGRAPGAAPKRIQVYTSNPLFPWELLVPTRSDGSPIGSFLGADYQIARLPKMRRFNTPDSVTLKEIAVLAPNAGPPLAARPGELAELKSLPGYTLIDPKFPGISKLLNNMPQGIIHFAGHGTARNAVYAIQLEDGEFDVNTLRGLLNKPPVYQPLFFLNACEMGQVNRMADFIDGWAPDILKSGGGGLIGGMWPLSDVGAAEFSKFFYHELKQRLAKGPVSVAELMREGRARFFQTADPTYLSYVFYGNVLFRVQAQPQAAL